MFDGIWNRLTGNPGRRTRALSPTHEGASGSRRMFSWNPGNAGPNAEVFADGDILRRRTRDMIRKNPWCASAVESYVANSISTGIVPQFQHADKARRTQLKEWWKQFADEVDSSGMQDLYGMQATGVRELAAAGEFLWRKRPRYLSDGYTVPLQVQALEADHLPFSKNDGAFGPLNITRAGIELDAVGDRAAYHLHRQHPGDVLIFPNTMQTVRVPADQIRHCYRVLRYGQLRGLPWFTPTLSLVYELDQYADSERVRKKLSTMLVGTFKRLNPDDPVVVAYAQAGTSQAAAGEGFGRMEPGTMMSLDPGEDLTFNNPPDTNTMYVEYERAQLRALFSAIGPGLTYEQCSFDLHGVTFSSIRSGTQEFRRRCEQFQFQTMVFQTCKPLLGWFYDALILGGLIDAREFAANKTEYMRITWRTPRWAYVNPVDDVKSEIMQNRALYKSRSMSIHDSGEDPDEVYASILEDNQIDDELGFVSDGDPRKTQNNGAEQQAPPQSGDPNGNADPNNG